MQSAKKARLLLPIEKTEMAILEFLSDGLEKHVNKIRDYSIDRAEVSQATFYNALKNLMNNGKVVRARPDYYKIVKKEDEKVEGEKK
jgi:predicted transcriptional regulator